MIERSSSQCKGCLIRLANAVRGRRAQSTIEFVTVIMLLLIVFMFFQKYIARGLQGRWKGVGDALGQGRIYDPNVTTECEYDPRGSRWFDRKCFDACRDQCISIGEEPTPYGCPSCVDSCVGNAQCSP